MIQHVWERAVASQVGDVIVACCHQRTADVITRAGGLAVLTDPALPTGTDRVNAVVKDIDFQGDYIVNLQGDMPFIDPACLRACVDVLQQTDVDIGTLGCPIPSGDHWNDPDVVKVLTKPLQEETREAYDFTRKNPEADHARAYYHLGVYAYRTASLKNFVAYLPTLREQERSLEQMRALDNNMRIGLHVVDTYPLSVDVQTDLMHARAYFQKIASI